MRVLAGVLLALLLVITTTSAYIRLAQTGLSCAGAPDCYAQRQPEAASAGDVGETTARALHRIAASTAGVVILVILFVGWGGARPSERVAAIGLLALAALLAWLGRYTPSSLPAVMLGNLLGGMAMLALGGWLLVALRRRRPAVEAGALRPWAWVALALVALQIAAGGLIAARHAAFACPSFPDCAGAVWPSGAQVGAFDPWREMAAPGSAADRTDPARQAVNLAHRWLALPTLALLAWIGVRAARSGVRASGLALLALSLAQLALGAAQVLGGQPLGLAVAHNIVAAAVVIALAALLARTKPS
ncbi:MAG: COX15/CtaA family protein [Burkholderiales bacterium]|jgi:cytochrome c oxidase assembly protein subunit 15|nr:COX15/CtaA family protein [Burkholderiales bacterium]